MKLCKLVFITLFFCTFCIAESLPNPKQNNLANFHLKDQDCLGACHKQESASEDLEFENRSCIECHDDFSGLEGKAHNLTHQTEEEMNCLECHLPHEETKPQQICSDCHEDDHEAFSQ